MRATIAILKQYWFIGAVCGAVVILAAFSFLVVYAWLPNATTVAVSNHAGMRVNEETVDKQTTDDIPPTPIWPAPLDTAQYNQRLLALAGFSSSTLAETVTVVTAAGTTTVPKYTLVTSSTTNTTIEGKLWPAANPYPNGGALLPFNRIVAYYGNFYSRNMGILGELDHDDLIAKFDTTIAAWEKADPTTPVLPAVHYIATVAQGTAGPYGLWRNIMPDEHIERAYDLAHELDGVLFLDLQVGLSTLEADLPYFREYLSRPDVHLGIDPEFSMKTGARPGSVIGTFDATDINYTIDYLADIVNEYQLPPKVLVVHRFTDNMVTNYQDIKPRPEVQVVIDMDGWGAKELKTGTYNRVIIPEPVEFTGMKLFYKNDLKPPSTGLFSPSKVLEFTPKPIYIQYQ